MELIEGCEVPASSLSTLDHWTAKFKRSRISLSDEDHSGRLNAVAISEKIERISDVVINGRKVEVRDFAKTIGTLIQREQNILTTRLDMKEL